MFLTAFRVDLAVALPEDSLLSVGVAHLNRRGVR